MSDISLQLREICQLHDTGQLTPSQFERAKEAVISSALAQAAAPPPPLPLVGAASSSPRVLLGATTAAATATAVPSVVDPVCPGGHGRLAAQSKSSVPASWLGRVSCTHCGAEGKAGRFLGCRRCDYDLCAPCAAHFSTPVRLPRATPPPQSSVSSRHDGGGAAAAEAAKREPSPLSQLAFSSARPPAPSPTEPDVSIDEGSSAVSPPVTFGRPSSAVGAAAAEASVAATTTAPVAPVERLASSGLQRRASAASAATSSVAPPPPLAPPTPPLPTPLPPPPPPRSATEDSDGESAFQSVATDTERSRSPLLAGVSVGGKNGEAGGVPAARNEGMQQAAAPSKEAVACLVVADDDDDDDDDDNTTPDTDTPRAAAPLHGADEGAGTPDNRAVQAEEEGGMAAGVPPRSLPAKTGGLAPSPERVGQPGRSSCGHVMTSQITLSQPTNKRYSRRPVDPPEFKPLAVKPLASVGPKTYCGNVILSAT